MQALLSYDRSPPLAAPFRFFLSVPLFGLLCGALLLWSGSEVFASRWTPAALALTHLVTAGFMLQAMLGALFQIMPVVAGANIVSPLRVARVVHGAISLGVLLLTAAFLSFSPLLFKWSAACFVVGLGVFIAGAASALRGVVSNSPTIHGIKLALFGLAVTAALGVALAASLGWSLNLPLMQLADTHAAWGLLAWATVLLAAVSYVVVPMFQLTPAYPPGFERRFALAILLAVSGWTLSDLAAVAWALPFAVLMVAGGAAYAGVTLRLQRQSKRPAFDATMKYWRFALLGGLAAAGIWLGAQFSPRLAEWPGWVVLCGVLLLFCAFMSVIVGMLYKIVPFLLWLHLQNLGQGRLMAPNMKKFISERAMAGQMRTHFAACGGLVAAVFWPETVVYPAAVVLMLGNFWLLCNLWSALRVYRAHRSKIDSLPTLK